MLKKLFRNVFIAALIAYPTLDAQALSRCSYRLDEHVDSSNGNWGKALNLDGCDFHVEDVPYLVTFLQQNTQPKVRTLLLDYYAIDDNAMTLLADAISTFHLLEDNASIFLQVNHLGDSSARALAHIQELRRLDLFVNNVTGVGAAALAKSNITTLYIPYNRLGDAGAIELAKSTSLIELDIRNNLLGNNGAIGLAKTTSIQSLNLGSTHSGTNDDNNIGDAGVAAYAQNTSITSFSIEGNNIGPAGAQALAKNSFITSLTLIRNHVGDGGASALASNTHIRYLDIAQNGVGDTGAIALSKNTTLTFIQLYWNNIGDAGAKALANVAHLDALRIFGNKIGQSGKAALEQAFIEKRISQLDD